MKGQYEMFPKATSKDTTDAISSLASECGTMPSNSQDGPKVAKSGPAPVPVNHFRERAREAGMPTNGICGPLGFGSSQSVNLTRSLESRYRVLTASLGSTLFDLTWKDAITPSGFSVPRQQARVRRTSGADCTSWPTPRTSDQAGHSNSKISRAEAGEMDWGKCQLREMATLSGLPPSSSPAGTESGGRQEKGYTLSSCSTPQVKDYREVEVREELSDAAKKGGFANFLERVHLASWNTPTTRDYKGANDLTNTLKKMDEGRRVHMGQLANQVPVMLSGPPSFGSPVGTESQGRLNPAFSRWLMGLPEEWCIAAVRAHRKMKSSRTKRVKQG